MLLLVWNKKYRILSSSRVERRSTMLVKFDFETIYVMDNNVHIKGTRARLFIPFQPSVVFHTQTSHLICSNQRLISIWNVTLSWNGIKRIEQVFAVMNRSFERTYKRVKVFKNRPSKICGRQPLKIWSDMVC